MTRRFLHASTVPVALVLSLCGLSQFQPARAQGDPQVTEVIRLLREPLQSQEDRNRVRELAKNFNEDQADELAMRVASLIRSGLDRKQLAVNTILNLYQVALGAADNPALEMFGTKVSDALKVTLGDLFDILNDPKTWGGANQLINALVSLGIDTPTAQDIAVDVVTRRPKPGDLPRRSSNAQSRSNDSLTFDAISQTLDFDEDVIVGVELLGGTTDLTDAIIGAEVLLPTFELSEIGPDGVVRFVNASSDPLSIVGDDGEFLRADLEVLLWNGTELFGFGTEALFSGTNGLPDLGSDFVASMVNAQDADEGFDDHLLFRIFPDEDLDLLTAGFTVSGTTAFANRLGLVESGLFPIPEPSSLVLTAPLLGLVFIAARRRVFRTHDS